MEERDFNYAFYNCVSSFSRFVHDEYTGYVSYGGSKNLDIAAEIKRR